MFEEAQDRFRAQAVRANSGTGAEGPSVLGSARHIVLGFRGICTLKDNRDSRLQHEHACLSRPLHTLASFAIENFQAPDSISKHAQLAALSVKSSP